MDPISSKEVATEPQRLFDDPAAGQDFAAVRGIGEITWQSQTRTGTIRMTGIGPHR